jgi:hypothetical protein
LPHLWEYEYANSLSIWYHSLYTLLVNLVQIT